MARPGADARIVFSWVLDSNGTFAGLWGIELYTQTCLDSRRCESTHICGTQIVFEYFVGQINVKSAVPSLALHLSLLR